MPGTTLTSWTRFPALRSMFSLHTHKEATNPLSDPHDQGMRLELLFETEQITDGRLRVCLLSTPALSA